jgi:transposase
MLDPPTPSDVINHATQERNMLMVCASRRGYSYRQIAMTFGVGKTHVGDIVSKCDTRIDDSEFCPYCGQRTKRR